MVIFKKLGINFVHAPKTGGSAICRALAVLEGNVERFDRLYAERNQALFHTNGGLHTPAKEKLPGLTICFTREPGDLMQSCYNYAVYRKQWNPAPPLGINAFLFALERKINLPLPACYYEKYGLHGYEANCDFIGDFHHIEESFAKILELAEVEDTTPSALIPYNQLPYPERFNEKQMARAAAAAKGLKGWKPIPKGK